MTERAKMTTMTRIKAKAADGARLCPARFSFAGAVHAVHGNGADDEGIGQVEIATAEWPQPRETRIMGGNWLVGSQGGDPIAVLIGDQNSSMKTWNIAGEGRCDREC